MPYKIIQYRQLDRGGGRCKITNPGRAVRDNEKHARLQSKANNTDEIKL